MRVPFPAAAAALFLATGAAHADVPRVAADFAPVHSLVAAVMGDLGAPGLAIRPGASVHDAALRPSEAALLEAAEVVFWVGPSLTPGLEKAMETLAGNARVVSLLEVGGTRLLPSREIAVFGAKAGDDHDHDHDDHDHDHDHDDHAHDHGDTDPHAWLDPTNATLWLGAIAQVLAEADPENALTYKTNADTAIAGIAGQAAAIRARFEAAALGDFVVYHDAYQYFETAFGIAPLGTVASGDAASPGPARIAALLDEIAAREVRCLLTEPGASPGLVALIAEGGLTVIEADPEGAALEPGPGLYVAMIADLADALVACAG